MRLRNVKTAAYRRYIKTDELASVNKKGGARFESFWVQASVELDPELRKIFGGSTWTLEVEIEPRGSWVEALIIAERESPLFRKETVPLEDFEREAIAMAFLSDRVIGIQGFNGYKALVKTIEEIEERYFGGTPGGDPDAVEVINLAPLRSISQRLL